MKKILFYTTFLTCLLGVNAQQTCTQRLNQAEDDYAAGRLLDIPSALEGCLGIGFSKEEEVRARKLLTLVYIFTDQQSKADAALINLLRADPEHRLDPREDPVELFFLYDQFRVAPIFRIGVKAGVNLTNVNVIQSYSTHNGLAQNKFYNGKEAGGIGEFQSVQGTGFNFEATIERYFDKGIEVISGVQWRVSKYNLDVETIDESFRLKTAAAHEQMYLRVPLIFRYNYGYSNRDQVFIPYGFLGVGYDYLLQSTYSNGERSPGAIYNTTGIDTRSAGITNKHGISLIGGLGTKIRIKTHFLTVEAQYNNSRIAYTNDANLYQNQESIFDLGFVEDLVSIDLFMFSVGWTQSIYSPKKLNVFQN